MKILIINKHFSQTIGGSEMQCGLIADGLSRRGHDVVYGTPLQLSNSIDDDKSINYLLVHLDLKSKESVRDFLDQQKPDIIYWRYNKHYLNNIIPVCKVSQTPFVFAVSHINDITKFAYKPKVITGFLGRFKSVLNILKQKRESARQFTYLKDISGLTSLNSEFLGKVNAPKERLIKNAVPSDQTDFNWDKPYIAWVSSIKASKRPESFIALAKSFKSLEIDFLMVGPVQQANYQHKLAEAQQLHNFHYLGTKTPEEVNGILNSALLLINTCAPEGFGNNFIQAWMQGCPTISLSFDPDGTISREGLGLVSGSQYQMEQDLKYLINNSQLRNEMGQKAKVFAQQQFSQERLASEVESFLLEILHENSLHR